MRIEQRLRFVDLRPTDSGDINAIEKNSKEILWFALSLRGRVLLMAVSERPWTTGAMKV